MWGKLRMDLKRQNVRRRPGSAHKPPCSGSSRPSSSKRPFAAARHGREWTATRVDCQLSAQAPRSDRRDAAGNGPAVAKRAQAHTTIRRSRLSHLEPRASAAAAERRRATTPAISWGGGGRRGDGGAPAERLRASGTRQAPQLGASPPSGCRCRRCRCGRRLESTQSTALRRKILHDATHDDRDEGAVEQASPRGP